MPDDGKVLSYSEALVRSPGKPRPARFKPLWPLVTGIAGSAVVAAGSFLALVGSRYTACRGSTRSTQLKWEERQREVANVIAQEQARQQLAEMSAQTSSQTASRDALDE